MNVLVGIQEGGFNGIDAYAEQVASALAGAGATVTLLASTAEVAKACRQRLAEHDIEIVDLGLTQPARTTEIAQRLWHGVRMRRLGAALASALYKLDRKFEVIHLNHPGLAAAARPWCERLVVAAWFYPHSLSGRLRETWRHTRGSILRRPVLTAKSIAFYRSDERGYRVADVVLCPTRTLAEQLRAQGRRAIVCPPPVELLRDAGGEQDDLSAAGEAGVSPAVERSQCRRLLVCCGDLSHPRKNIKDVVRAARHLPESLGEVEIIFVGGSAESIQAQARNLPRHIRAEFPGRMQPADLHALMRQVDALVIPSLYEEWGYVVVESLLANTPAIAYPVHPFPDMLSGGLGFVASAITPCALAEAIDRCLTTDRASDLSQGAAARFGSGTIATRLLAIYRGSDPDEIEATESAAAEREEA